MVAGPSDCVGLPLDWAVEVVLPVLATVEAACTQTIEAPVVSQAVATGVRELETR